VAVRHELAAGDAGNGLVVPGRADHGVDLGDGVGGRVGIRQRDRAQRTVTETTRLPPTV